MSDYESPAIWAGPIVWEAKFISFFERIFRSAVDEIFQRFKWNFLFLFAAIASSELASVSAPTFAVDLLAAADAELQESTERLEVLELA